MKNTILIMALGFFTLVSTALMAQPQPKPTNQQGQQVEAPAKYKNTCRRTHHKNNHAVKGKQQIAQHQVKGTKPAKHNDKNGKACHQKGKKQVNQARHVKGQNTKNRPQRPNCGIKPAKQNTGSRTIRTIDMDMDNRTQTLRERGQGGNG